MEHHDEKPERTQDGDRDQPDPPDVGEEAVTANGHEAGTPILSCHFDCNASH